MATLNVASRANQASTLPALLVAQYAKERDHTVSINFNIEDVDTLKSSDGATVELVEESGKSVYGCRAVVDKLLSAHPDIQGKNDNTVSVGFRSLQGWMFTLE